MRRALFFLSAVFTFSACNSKKEDSVPAKVETHEADAANFFPVTSFIKGEIANIKNIGITPVRKTLKEGRVLDSAFVKPEDYNTAFADFLSPVIDSANVKGMFTETKFKDETLDAFTFTYDPAGSSTNAFPFLHWDVYVDPESGKVKRVYLIKKAGGDKQLQLTWKSGKSCSIITVNTGANGGIEKQETISWNYDKE